jgi:sterol desaturase/sphingolipid hydroxylase (fatty acid hydroxylase superfamily)
MDLLGSFWRSRRHHLDRMTVGELVKVFYQYPAIVAYHALLVASAALSVELRRPGLDTALWVGIAWVNFSLTWYLLHRFLLQSRLLYRFRLTAALWKRIHYDHHRDPNDLRVLFGALYTTLPPMGLQAGAVALLTRRLDLGLAFLATSLGLTVWSELCHCLHHLSIDPGLEHLRRIRKLHRIHHFHNENVYYGITTFLWDRLFGTFPPRPSAVPPSPTVYTLGYEGVTARRFPWVRRLDRPAAAERAAAAATATRDRAQPARG